MKKPILFLLILVLLSVGCTKTMLEDPVVDPSGPICNSPTNLNLFTLGDKAFFNWDDANSGGSNYYEVQYGVTGFALGTGTLLTTSSTQTSELVMAAGNAYQFYVRAYCDAAVGYGQWAGPYSYFTNANFNMCIPPSSLQYTIQTNAFSQPIGANFTWAHNGETRFEFTIVGNGASPNSGSITNWYDVNGTPTVMLTQDTDYDFYVRAFCLNGTRTVWVGPLDVNIGH